MKIRLFSVSVIPLVSLAFLMLNRVQPASTPLEAYALQFNGRPDYVVVTQSPTLNVGLDMTIEFWVKTIASYEGPYGWNHGQWLLDKDITGQVQPDWAVVLKGGKVVFDNGNPDGEADQPLYGNALVNDGSWHHVAITRDSSSGLTTIYVDGGIDAQGTFSTADLSNTEDLKIGAMDETSVLNAYVGELDDLRLWNVVRSQGDIQAHRHCALTGSEPGLVGYWRFDDGTGQVAADATSNHNDGQLGSTSSEDGNDPVWNTAGRRLICSFVYLPIVLRQAP